MIILEPLEEASSKAAEAALHRADLPPIYTESEYTESSSATNYTSPSVSNTPVSSSATSSNYVSVSRHFGSIKSSFTIDPSLRIPASLLPDLFPGESTHRNLHIETRHGPIRADISLLPSPQRAVIWLKSWNGRVEASLNRQLGMPSPSFYLNASTLQGRIIIQIPRSFCGPIIARSSYGPIKCSPALKLARTTFSDTSGLKKYFIGDLSRFNETPDWGGDEIVAETGNGSILLLYNDEALEPSSGLMSKFLDKIIYL
ncbi:hypothetical protein C8J56DRAFT_338423 [Mycena floridula]|nr:hypothetical protein C8J56DRAFT_338423 [Mycena floridula]